MTLDGKTQQIRYVVHSKTVLVDLF